MKRIQTSLALCLSLATGICTADAKVTIDIKVNGSDNPVIVKSGDTVNFSINEIAGDDDAGLSAEYWLGLSGAAEKKWFHNGEWVASETYPRAWKVEAIKSVERQFSWTPSIPGVYMLQMIVDDVVEDVHAVNSIYASDQVVITVKP